MTQMHALPDSRDTLARPSVHLVSGDLLGGLTPDSVAYGLKVGDRWGACWLHADGMMRLYPPCECENGIIRSLGLDNDEIIDDCPRCAKFPSTNAAPASRELAPLDCKRPDQPGQAQLSSPNPKVSQGHGRTEPENRP